MSLFLLGLEKHVFSCLSCFNYNSNFMHVREKDRAALRRERESVCVLKKGNSDWLGDHKERERAREREWSVEPLL